MKARFLLAAAACALAASLFSGLAQAGGLLAKKHGCGPAGCGVHGCGVHGCRGCGLHGCLHHGPLCAHGGKADALARAQSAGVPWDGGYWHTMWGQPVALVVPPTAELQTHYNWGVAQTSVTPIWHQYQRAYPGPFVPGGRAFLPTPNIPSSTDQFGVYYIRGPW
jgi:hypothetical protein